MAEPIVVFMSSDDEYAPFAATTMVSILEHTEASVKFYVADCGISERKSSGCCTFRRAAAAKLNMWFWIWRRCFGTALSGPGSQRPCTADMFFRSLRKMRSGRFTRIWTWPL